MSETPTADELADMVLPLDGPYPPDQVIEAARLVAEAVRRLNFATFHNHSLRYPPQLDRVVGALKAALYGLEQTFGQLATRLDGFADDGRVEHDNGRDASAAATQAAQHLRHAAYGLLAVTGPLDEVTARTHHLGYDTSTRRSPRRTATPAAEIDAPQVPGPLPDGVDGYPLGQRRAHPFPEPCATDGTHPVLSSTPPPHNDGAIAEPTNPLAPRRSR